MNNCAKNLYQKEKFNVIEQFFVHFSRAQNMAHVKSRLMFSLDVLGPPTVYEELY